MVPAIGIMIAAYIITRMIDLLSKETKTIVKVVSCITILVTLVSAVDILNAGAGVAGLR
jgi:hypothetical protein